METTLIILKPDAVQRGLMGRIVSRFEEKGLQIVGAKLTMISPELAATHYKDHQGKGFYNGLVGFMTSSPVLVLAVRGIGAITMKFAASRILRRFGFRPVILFNAWTASALVAAPAFFTAGTPVPLMLAVLPPPRTIRVRSITAASTRIGRPSGRPKTVTPPISCPVRASHSKPPPSG